MIIVPIIKTHDISLEIDNIRLRPMSDNDFDILLKWNSDAEVLYYSEGNDVESYGLEDIQGIYGGVSSAAFCFIIEFEGVAIGECWLQKMNLEHVIKKHPDVDVRRIDLMIGEKEYWGKGIGTKVVKLLTKFGFETDKVEMIYYMPYDYNVRSCKAAERVGYKLLDKIPVSDNPKAKFELHYVMTRDDFFRLSNQTIWDNLYSNSSHTPTNLDWIKTYNKYFSKRNELSVIDLGCGRGDNSKFLSEAGYKVIACDFSPAAIEYINQTHPQIETCCFDMVNAFPDDFKNIGIVLASLSTHYFSLFDTVKLYDKIYDTLEPGGYFIFRVNSKGELENKDRSKIKSMIEEDYYLLEDGNTKRYFDVDSVSKLLSKFDIINIQEAELEYRGHTKYFIEGIAQKQ